MSKTYALTNLSQEDILWIKGILLQEYRKPFDFTYPDYKQDVIDRAWRFGFKELAQSLQDELDWKKKGEVL